REGVFHDHHTRAVVESGLEIGTVSGNRRLVGGGRNGWRVAGGRAAEEQREPRGGADESQSRGPKRAADIVGHPADSSASGKSALVAAERAETPLPPGECIQ